MKQISKWLTFSNVMSAIAVFLVLGGATAFAASQLGKNTVGPKQLKKNAVTAAKIKKEAVNTAKIKNAAVTDAKIKDGAVTGGKIQNGAVTGEKVADGSLTGADINSSTAPFSQIVARLRNAGPINLQAAGPTLVGSYTQPAGQNDLYFAGLDVTFSAGCNQPRSAVAYLLIDPPNPFEPTPIAGIGVVQDKSPGAVTKHLEIGEYGIGGGAMKQMAPSSAQGHTFYLYIAPGSCSSGSGIIGSNLGVDVLGTK